MTKDIFAEERQRYKIQEIISHHGHGKTIIMIRKLSKSDLGTKKGIERKTMMSEPNFGGKLRTK